MEPELRLESRPLSAAQEQSRLPALAAIAAGIAVLYFAKDVFLPLAIAVLLTFMLAPIVSSLRRLGLPRLPAIITSVSGGFLVIVLFSAILAFQVSEVGQNIATYQYNIIEKIRTLKEAGTDNSLISRLNRFVERVGAEINQDEERATSAPGNAEVERKPILVEIFAQRNPIETLETVIGPLVGPLATLGLVIVVVVFMLLEREELRDRFIRLVGYGDLHRTTIALQEAGSRVGRYLLTQLMVNIAYGVPLGIGLWVLGIPNALLWGMLAVLLRFAPYIGPVIAAVMPLFLAFAIAPGWNLLLWTIGLFIVIELISNNVMEPWLYGSRTGLSPLAIIVAAIFWTWLWGPIGLVLSTPLTVCLVVLGRYVPQFRFLEILFGAEPVLNPHERLYQRLLSGDPNEATDNALEFLSKAFLVEYYGSVAIPALLIAEQDRVRGVLSDTQLSQLSHSARLVVANLRQIAEEEEDNEEEVAVETVTDGEQGEALQLPSGDGKSIICLGGRGPLDDVSAAMLAQVLAVQGATSRVVDHEHSQPSQLRRADIEHATAIVLCVLDLESASRAKFLLRRLRRLNALARIGLAIWRSDGEVEAVDEARLRSEIEADFVAFDLLTATLECLSDARPNDWGARPAKMLRKRPQRPKEREMAGH
ncbi:MULTISPECIES: AI-2E family transporter [Ochrobactrum]|uniref:AI-2E family transporter n=1 Tax=Ochrobactrum quorumnocens TaxID=271865 RepID=A0A5N1K101_9HYPH|nr:MULTISPECIES: AI-2E family transporter [Brucella/Ochrobactrum group]KAA9368231.1 AI-2E family transporter [[Ochrobactrum] quorumnocens]MDH7792424.1 putative PurR-regulated permease PerM [Ochrobactrum sp. AN78]